MSATELRQSFRRRFRAVARQIWSLHVGRGVARTVLVAAVLVAAVATADYFFELSWAARAGLAGRGGGRRGGARRACGSSARRWPGTGRGSRPNWRDCSPASASGCGPPTQHGERPADELARDGVAPGLVAALEEETAEKVKPLPFQAALPVRPALVAGRAGAGLRRRGRRGRRVRSPSGGPP